MNFDEADVFVDCRLYHWVTLVVLLHQHQQTREGHSEHLGKLLGINGGLLRLEHAWLLPRDSRHLVLVVVVLHAFLVDLSLVNFVLNVSCVVVLPLVV